ncbi:MAG: LPS export ABC transporter periplasmic protein LptC [Ignavibacteria bacterium]|nr:LPS export ABC transporter periplasmic protein LptC [Ignavibacteria bacterium]
MKSKFICFITLALNLLFLYSCSSDKFEPPKTDIVSSDSIPSQESFHTTVTFSDSGKVKAILQAGRIRVFTKLNYTLIDSGAKVDFYKEGVYSSTLTGKRGKIYDNTKDVEVYDSVKLVSQDGSVLTTNKLLWVNKTQKIKSDEFVHIKTVNEDIQGYGFEADQNLKNYVIYKVSGEVLK